MNIIKLSAIDSTNSYLKELLKEGVVASNTVVWTSNQTTGRGQRGNSWYSEPNNSLACSIYRSTLKQPECWEYTPAVLVSLGVKKVLENQQIPAVSIKWPNDIMSYNKKIGGILIENIWSKGKPLHQIIGIGLNINNTQFPDLPQAGSLKKITGKSYSIEVMMESIAQEVVGLFTGFKPAKQQQYHQEFKNNLFRLNQVATFSLPTGVIIPGIIRGVTPNGLLQVEMEDESLKEFDLKQIKLLY